MPDSALHIYQQVETFRTWTAQLDMVVSKHNTDLARLLPVEKPLLQPYLDRFDRAIEAGLSALNWETGGNESAGPTCFLAVDAASLLPCPFPCCSSMEVEALPPPMVVSLSRRRRGREAPGIATC